MEQKPSKSTISYRAQTIAVLAVTLELGFIISLPIILLGTWGKHLDTAHHKHYFVYIGIAVAALCTTLGIYKRYKGMVETLNKSTKAKE